MSVISTNLISLMIKGNQRNTDTAMGQAISRLSSGLKINSAKDAPAGQAVANRMESSLQSRAQISRGINDAIGLTQTANGGLDEINHLLQRSRELAVQAASGGLSDPDRASINEEFNQLRTEIDRITTSTEIFGQYPLAQPRFGPAEPPKLGDIPPLSDKFPVKGGTETFDSGIKPMAYIPKGTTDIVIDMYDHGANDDIQIFTADGKHLVGTGLGADNNSTWSLQGIHDADDMVSQVFTPENGFNPGASYDASELLQGIKKDGPYTKTLDDGTELEYSGDGNGPNNTSLRDLNEHVKISETKENLIFMVVGRGRFNASVSWGTMPPPEQVLPPPNRPPHSGSIDIVMSSDYGSGIDTLTLKGTPSDSKTLGIDETALDSQENASKALAELDKALATVEGYRGYYGSVENRFDSAVSHIASQQLETSAYQSQIQDANYATESSNLVRTQILQQAKIAMMAQANQLPETALKILRGS